MDSSSQSGLPTMGSSPNSDEQLESARHTQVSLDISEGEVHDSDDNVQLSSFQQWKLVMKKSALLMSRDTSNTLCMCLSPAIIILAISALVLLGGDDSYDPSLGITYSMRDSSMTAMAVDKNNNDASIFKSQKQLVGDVLFATASTSEVPLTSTAHGISVENLCKFVMNDARDIYNPTASVPTSTQGLYRQAYKAAKAVDSSFTIMPTTCSGGNSDGTTGTCTCASGTQIFDSIESLEDKMLALADTGSYKLGHVLRKAKHITESKNMLSRRLLSSTFLSGLPLSRRRRQAWMVLHLQHQSVR